MYCDRRKTTYIKINTFKTASALHVFSFTIKKITVKNINVLKKLFFLKLYEILLYEYKIVITNM